METKEVMLESAEHRALRQSLRRLLDRHTSQAARLTDGSAEQTDPELWRRLANELGVGEMAVPEEFDGAGFGARELAITAEELGRRLLPSPFLATVVMGIQLLLETGDQAAIDTYLPGLMDGSKRATVLLPQHGAGWSIATTSVAAFQSTDGTSQLRGSVTHVIDGGSADILIVPARTSDGTIQLYVVTEFKDAVRSPNAALDHTRAFAEVMLNDCTAVLVSTDDAVAVTDRAMTVAAACLASEQLGVAQYMLDTAVEYARDRHQFGRAIGSFQAVKHKLADSLLGLELARATVHDALIQLEDGQPTARRAVSIAKLVASEAGYDVCANAMQIFGGIGVTWEHHAHLYLKRASGNRVLLGRPEVHREYIASSLSL